MEDPKVAVYKEMLLNVAEIVDRDRSTLEAMKFRCDHIIKGRERDQIKSCLQLWTSLEKREYLGINNTQFIKELLMACVRGNMEPVRIVETYQQMLLAGNFNQQRIPPNQFVPSTNCPQIVHLENGFPRQRPAQHRRQVYGEDLQNEFQLLSKSLGRDWAFFVRELSLPESEIENVRCDYKYTREQIYHCLLAWQDIQKENATKDKLIEALQAVGRNDLVQQLECGNYK